MRLRRISQNLLLHRYPASGVEVKVQDSVEPCSARAQHPLRFMNSLWSFEARRIEQSRTSGAERARRPVVFLTSVILRPVPPVEAWRGSQWASASGQLPGAPPPPDIWNY